jgi:hypothetical protein
MKTTHPLCLLCALLWQISAQGQCSSTSGPNGGTSSGSSGGGINWSNPSRVQAKDFSYSVSSATFSLLGGSSNSKYLTLTNFGISVPMTATICGIQMDVYGFATGLISLSGTVSDNSVKIIKGGSIGGAEMATGAGWSGTYGSTTYGGNGSLWGQSWLPADVNSANFGVAISMNFTALVGVSLAADIDYIQATVYYSNIVLDMPLQNFSAKKEDETALLSWTTSTPSNLTSVSVQRSDKSGKWQDLAKVNPIADRTQYTYNDPTPLAGVNNYRLHMLSNTGPESFSSVQEIDFVAGARLSVFPNPVASTLNISSPEGIHRVLVKDMTGKTLSMTIADGQTREIQVQVSTLRPGIYLLEVDKKVVKWIKN